MQYSLLSLSYWFRLGKNYIFPCFKYFSNFVPCNKKMEGSKKKPWASISQSDRMEVWDEQERQKKANASSNKLQGRSTANNSTTYKTGRTINITSETMTTPWKKTILKVTDSAKKVIFSEHRLRFERSRPTNLGDWERVVVLQAAEVNGRVFTDKNSS